MKIAVVTRPNMHENSTRLSVLAALKEDGSFEVVECNDGHIPSDTDKILVFGGDGTVLQAVRDTHGSDVEILSVNLGNMGFLATFENSVEPKKVIDALKNGVSAPRMLLEAVSDGKSIGRALNEVVVKSVSSRPICIDLYVNESYVDSYHSDGIIVSTPTGSTAYSFSAGGPVLTPDVEAIIINPVCPHSLHSRPLVVSASAEIMLCMNSTGVDGYDRGAEASVSIDVEEVARLNR
ncbi:MAG: NAD(+)/NADH kinase, partial [Clostridia bacterium]|nr:NAD(+)/NADH kinase [Clostridia bacterium]